MREAFGADINVILTGKAGGVAPDLRPDEDQLLAHYRAAHSDARERIRQIAATAANSPKRGAKDVPPPEPEAKRGPRITIGTQHGNSYSMEVGSGTVHGGISIGDLFGGAQPAPPKKGTPP